MSGASGANSRDETLQAYCDCAKRETTWVRATEVRGSGKPRLNPRTLLEGWKCLNCGKFRPDHTPGVV